MPEDRTPIEPEIPMGAEDRLEELEALVEAIKEDLKKLDQRLKNAGY